MLLFGTHAHHNTTVINAKRFCCTEVSDSAVTSNAADAGVGADYFSGRDGALVAANDCEHPRAAGCVWLLFSGSFGRCSGCTGFGPQAAFPLQAPQLADWRLPGSDNLNLEVPVQVTMSAPGLAWHSMHSRAKHGTAGQSMAQLAKPDRYGTAGHGVQSMA